MMETVPLRVLIVMEDFDPPVQGAVRDLDGEDFDVRTVQDADEASTVLTEEKFDVAVIGPETAESEPLFKQFVEAVSASETPWILLSVPDRPQLQKRALEAGAVDTFDLDEVSRPALYYCIRHSVERERRRRTEWELQSMLELKGTGTPPQRDELIRFQADLLNQVSQAIVATGLHGRVLYWNRAAEKIFGWSTEQALGEHILDVTVPTDQADKARHVMKVVREGESWTGELEFLRADGTRFMAVANGSPIRGPDGEIAGTIGIVSDITETKETELALRERVKELQTLYQASQLMNEHDSPLDERLRKLVKIIPEGWLYTDVTEACIVVEDTTESTPGFRETPWMQTAPIEGPQRRLGTVEVALTEERPERDEGPFLKEERSLIDSLARTIGDAVERGRLSRLLEQTFASLDEAVLIVDARDDSGRLIRDVNHAAERMFGYSRDELIGQTTEKIHVDRAAFERFAEEGVPVLEDEGVFKSTYPLRRKDGSTFDAEQTVTLLEPDEGLDGGVVSVIRDVSSRAELERKLRRSQKMEAIGRLAGGVAHDFNNLLTVIRVQADFLMMESEGFPELRQEVELIQEATERAAKLTEQLLAFSREQELQPRIVDLSEIVQGTGRMLDRIIGANIALRFDLSDDLPAVKVDPGQLQQVLLNLAVNARDAMPRGGTLTFATKQGQVGVGTPAETADLPPGEYVVLQVSDTGRGMGQETMNRIFEPFFSTKEPGKGTGLGLAMAYGVVNQSGGAIHATSTVGQGTTFHLFFPTTSGEAEPTEESAPRSETPPPQTPTCVLLVEDSQDVRRVAVRLLERAGYRVEAHPDAESAWEMWMAGDVDIDIVLTDLMLPVMSGPELVDRIRKSDPDIPVVAMSGYSEGLADRTRLPEDVVFVGKPFRRQQLLDALNEALATSTADDT